MNLYVKQPHVEFGLVEMLGKSDPVLMNLSKLT